jgi:hypothetical protein
LFLTVTLRAEEIKRFQLYRGAVFAALDESVAGAQTGHGGSAAS